MRITYGSNRQRKPSIFTPFLVASIGFVLVILSQTATETELVEFKTYIEDQTSQGVKAIFQEPVFPRAKAEVRPQRRPYSSR